MPGGIPPSTGSRGLRVLKLRWRVKSTMECLNLESAVEHGFVGNLGVPGKASFAVNGYSLNKNDNAAGCVGIFHKFL
jgi:hypothetical protein